MDKKRIMQNKVDVKANVQDKNKLSELKELVARFSNNIDQYVSNNYDEAKTRVDFIDKFFELLDWDLSNKQGFSEAYRDVIREDKIRIEGNQKAPDYCFKIGVERKFFVEAKKPSVNIKDDIGAAYQLRRYAYSAKLPLSILTDFHELAVYDTRIKPRPKDNASVARVFYCKFDEYEQNFDYLYNTFSKNAILKGSFDRYVADNKKKKGTSEVDKEFLKLIEDWRNELAKNLAINNIKLDLYSLNTAVQKIIDRIIFLRIAEARNIEEFENLDKIADSSNVYKKLDAYFQQSDARYNSGLFHIENWLSDLKIDDKILKDIIKSTYYPESPYEFSVLPVEILGNIYEQFLGKVIHLTATHQAKIEEKPEVKKAGGVYYTPQYIVDYIVKNTVGEKLKDSTPEKVEKLKICDPACGSGSFLLGAYAYLLRWHLDFYTKDKKSLEKYKKLGKIYDYKGDFKLTIDEKRKILKNNIFGVDIDGQAVEVTKLSLLLKLMEDETQQSAGMLIKFSKEALLPDLSDNIKCGNSLIGTDFYGSKNMSLFGSDEMRKVNAFDWDKEFKEIFGNGGFDVVIGNPPWVFTKYVDWGESTKNYISNKYLSLQKSNASGKAKQSGKINLFAIFILKGIEILKTEGVFSYIIPNTILRTTTYDVVRKQILNTTQIEEIVDLKAKVFEGVTASTVILKFKKGYKKNNKIKIIDSPEGNSSIQGRELLLSQDNFLTNVSFALNIFVDESNIKLLSKIKNGHQFLGGFCRDIIEGIVAHSNLITEESVSNSFPLLEGKSIDHYFIRPSRKFIKWEIDKIHRTRPDYLWQAKEKIVIRRISGGNSPLVAALDNNKYKTFASLNNLLLKPEFDNLYNYMLALLNSKVVNYYYANNFSNKSNLTVNISKTFLEKLPIPGITNENLPILNHLIDQMLEVQKKFHSAKTEADKKLYQQKIEILDGQIDGEVYKLYGLSPEDIKIVEGEFKEKK